MSTGINNLPFPGKVYNPFDILTAEELNEDVSNIESLADGSGIGDGAVSQNNLSSDVIFLGLAEKTNNQTFTAAANTQITGLSPTATVPTGGRRVKLTYSLRSTSDTNLRGALIRVWEGDVGSGTEIFRNDHWLTTGGIGVTMSGSYIYTPTAGSKTYNISYFITNGASTHTISGASQTAQLIAELI